MSGSIVRTQISMDRALYERAKETARRRGISLAELCRRSLAEAVSRQPIDKPWMAFLGDLEGHPDDSSTVDDMAYGRDAQ